MHSSLKWLCFNYIYEKHLQNIMIMLSCFQIFQPEINEAFSHIYGPGEILVEASSRCFTVMQAYGSDYAYKSEFKNDKKSIAS